MALVLSLALLSAQLSMRLRADTLHELFQSELGTLFGRPFRPESQNRILPAGMLVLLRDIVPATISDKSVWFASRLFQAVLAYVVLYAVAFRLTGGRLRALAAVGLVGYFYIWTPLSHPWEYTSDFLDILFISAFVGLALDGRSYLLGFTVILAAMNRESAAFAGIIWAGLATVRYGPWPENWRRFVPAAFYVLLAATVVLGLRYVLGGALHPQELGIVDVFVNWRWIRYPDGVLPMIAATLLALVVVLRGLPRPWTADQKGLFVGAIGCAVVSLVFGIVGELRVWLPCCTIVSLLAVIGAPGRSDQQWVASFFDADRSLRSAYRQASQKE